MSNSDASADIRKRTPVPIDKCGAALATHIISDRWTILIIREAFYGVKRYDDIREDIGIPRSVLTSRLKRLVAQGILEREPYREAGARTRYAYKLTEMGRGLGLVLLALTDWGDRYLKNGQSAIDVIDIHTGKKLMVGLVDKVGRIRTFADIAIKPR